MTLGHCSAKGTRVSFFFLLFFFFSFSFLIGAICTRVIERANRAVDRFKGPSCKIPRRVIKLEGRSIKIYGRNSNGGGNAQLPRASLWSVRKDARVSARVTARCTPMRENIKDSRIHFRMHAGRYSKEEAPRTARRVYYEESRTRACHVPLAFLLECPCRDIVVLCLSCPLSLSLFSSLFREKGAATRKRLRAPRHIGTQPLALRSFSDVSHLSNIPQRENFQFTRTAVTSVISDS